MTAPTPEEAAHEMFEMCPNSMHETFIVYLKRRLEEQREAGRREGAEKMREEAIACDWTGGDLTNLSVDAVLAADDQEGE